MCVCRDFRYLEEFNKHVLPGNFSKLKWHSKDLRLNNIIKHDIYVFKSLSSLSQFKVDTDSRNPTCYMYKHKYYTVFIHTI